MSYQLKYLDMPDNRRESGGAGGRVVKWILELAVTVVALNFIYNYVQHKQQADIPQNIAAIQQQATNTAAPMLQQAGLATPDASSLEEAQKMAQQFMSTGDLSDFENNISQHGANLGF